MPVITLEEVGGADRPPGYRRRNTWRLLYSGAKYGSMVAQVVASLVLVILATVLPSPTQPHKKQNQPTEDCPHPQLFEGWIGANVGVVTLSLMATAWSAYRKRRAMAMLLRTRPDVERPTASNSSAAARRRRRRQRQRRELEQARPIPLARVRSLPDMRAMPSARRSSRPPGAASSPAVHLYPSAAMSPGPSTPGPSLSPIHSPDAGISTASLSLRTPDLYKLPDAPADSQPQGLALGLPTIPSLPPALMRQAEAPAPPAAVNMSTPTLPRVSDSPVSSRTTFGPYPAPYVTNAERRQQRRQGWMTTVDALATRLAGWSGLCIVFLFILGNILVFRPLPSAPNSCHKGAPLLWWGVMVPVAYTWAIIAYLTLFFLVLYAFYLVISILRATGLINIPEWVGGQPQPEPLSNVDLLRCKLVCYVPDPNEGPPSPDPDEPEDPSADLSGEPVPIGEIDYSRLPNPAVVLPPHRASCGICQENFTVPREVPGRIMYNAPSLRQLPCEHTFHSDCIDQWLLEQSGRCPYCNKSIQEMLAEQTSTAAAVSTTAIATSESAVPAGIASANTLPTAPQTPTAPAPALQEDVARAPAAAGRT